MRRPVLIATTAVGAALAAGLIAVPALAGTGAPTVDATTEPAPTATATYSCDGTGSGAPEGAGGRGMQNGRGAQAGKGARAGGGADSGMVNGPGGGVGRSADPLAGLVQGTLTADQEAKLAEMAEEEKLAHDVYGVLAERTGDARFARIAESEARHLTAVRALLTRYGITDPTAGTGDGQFASDDVQGLYRDLVGRGSVSLGAALAVGRDIENLDLKDLAAARTGVTAQDVAAVYTRLANGSQRHLKAFGG